MPYGTVKVDNIIFTDGGADRTITVSGLYASTSGSLTVTGTISGATVQATSGIITSISGTTIQTATGIFGLGSAASPSITFSGDLDNGIYSPGANQVAISTSGTGRLFIDSSGRMLVGTSTARNNFYNSSSTATPTYQIEGTDYNTSSSAIVCNSTNALIYPLCILAKSAGSTVGSNTAVSNGHILGQISFQGNDGTEFIDGANIVAYVDGVSGANDLPTALLFGTTADGASAPTERMRIDSSGRVGIGVTNPAFDLVLANASGSILAFNRPNRTAGTIGGIYSTVDTGQNVSGSIAFVNTGGITAATAIQFTTYDGSISSERARIDSSGRLLVGTSTARSFQSFDAGGARLQLEGTVYQSSSASFINNQATIDGAYLLLGKSRGTSLGSTTIVSSGDLLGSIWFAGADGSVLQTGAIIAAYVDGTPGANDMPGRLMFSTTADGASSPTERMRIDSSGRVGIGTTSPTYKLQVVGTIGVQRLESSGATFGAPALNIYDTAHNVDICLTGISGAGTFGTYTNHPLAFYTQAAERMRITSDGYIRLDSTSGGIQFNGDTAAVNALDDYEEGTFTPTIIGTSVAGTGTYTAQVGRYTKIGNRVHFQLYIFSTAHTGSGNMRVSGLPFTSNSTTNNYCTLSTFYTSVTLAANNIMVVYVFPGSTEIILAQTPVGGGTGSAVSLDPTSEIMFAGSYEV